MLRVAVVWLIAALGFVYPAASLEQHQRLFLGQTGSGNHGSSFGSVPLGARFMPPNLSTGVNIVAGSTLARNSGHAFVNRSGQGVTGVQVHHGYVLQSNSTTSSPREWIIDNAGNGSCTQGGTTISISGGSGSGGDYRPVVTGGFLTAIYAFATGSGYLPGETPTLTVGGDCTSATAHINLMGGAGEAPLGYEADIYTSLEYPLGTWKQIMWAGNADHGTVGRRGITSSLPLNTVTVPNGGYYRFKNYELYRSVTATLGIVGTLPNVTSVPITNPGSGMWTPSYACTFVGGTGTTAACTAYTYQGQVVFVDLTSGGNYTVLPTSIRFTLNEQRPCRTSAATVDVFDTNSVNETLTTSTTAVGFSAERCQLLATGFPVTSAIPAVGIISDSIAAGYTGGDVNGDADANMGPYSRAFGQAGKGLTKIAVGGYSLQYFIAGHAFQLDELSKATGLKHVILGLGINDVALTPVLATLQSNMLASAVLIKTALPSVKVWVGTLTPNSTSSDGYRTLVNQLVATNFGVGSVTANFNDWIRAGGPIVGGVAVAIGTPGAILFGDPSHPIGAYYDAAAALESSQNSFLWKLMANAAVLITTSVHPSDEYGQSMSGMTSSLTVNGGSGCTTASVALSNLDIPSVTANITAGVINTYTVNGSGGYFFDYVPPVRILPIGGTGSGATATAVLSGGSSGTLTGVTKVAGGTLYSSGAFVSIAGLLPPVITPSVSGGSVVLSLDYSGSGTKTAYTIGITSDCSVAPSATPNIFKAIDPTLFNFLLKRDIDPASNDNDPMWLAKAA